MPWPPRKSHLQAQPHCHAGVLSGDQSPLLFPGTVEEQLYWFGIRTVLVPIASCLLLLVLVILLVRMER